MGPRIHPVVKVKEYSFTISVRNTFSSEHMTNQTSGIEQLAPEPHGTHNNKDGFYKEPALIFIIITDVDGNFTYIHGRITHTQIHTHRGAEAVALHAHAHTQFACQSTREANIVGVRTMKRRAQIRRKSMQRSHQGTRVAGWDVNRKEIKRRNLRKSDYEHGFAKAHQ